MHPAFADRIARRLIVVKRDKGPMTAAALSDRVMGYAPKGHPDYLSVLERINHYKGKGTVKDD
jgi:hypothetical protein